MLEFFGGGGGLGTAEKIVWFRNPKFSWKYLQNARSNNFVSMRSHYTEFCWDRQEGGDLNPHYSQSDYNPLLTLPCVWYLGET